MTDEKRRYISRLSTQNKEIYKHAYNALERLLGSTHHHSWMYVYELTQNALDAGAKRVSWRQVGEELRFEHDGKSLEEKHVRGIASLSESTKKQQSIGFMGIGFKAVYSRFREVVVSGGGWAFGFECESEVGDFGAEILKYTGGLEPVWREDAKLPSRGYTTLFVLGQVNSDGDLSPSKMIEHDLQKLTPSTHSASLVTLALGGLEELVIDERCYRFEVNRARGRIDVLVETAQRDPVRESWKIFSTQYTPSDAAIKALLKARKQTREERDKFDHRLTREVIALLPLKDGLPSPPTRGTVYSTLATSVKLPFGFHLQADWLVGIDRSGLHEIERNAWQLEILDQVPELVGQYLTWLSHENDACREKGYAALEDPTLEGEEDIFRVAFDAMRDDFVERLAAENVFPAISAPVGPCRFHSLHEIGRLPKTFENFLERKPTYRSDLLFGVEILDERLLGERGKRFVDWLGSARSLSPREFKWPDCLGPWWSSLEPKNRSKILFLLWEACAKSKFCEAPVVPTRAGTWVKAADIRLLKGTAPTAEEIHGEHVLSAIMDKLPGDEVCLDEEVEKAVGARKSSRVHRYTLDPPFDPNKWLEDLSSKLELKHIIKNCCKEQGTEFPLVSLASWVVHKKKNEHSLIPYVLTSADEVRPPAEVLLADPFVPSGSSRRRLYPDLPSLSSKYNNIQDKGGLQKLLESAGIRGKCVLVETNPASYGAADAARELGLEVAELQKAKRSSKYKLFDVDFENTALEPEAMHDWMAENPLIFRGKGKLKAKSRYRGEKITTGKKSCAWLERLREMCWVPCEDGIYRAPGDVLLEVHIDADDAPIAFGMNGLLAKELKGEGLEFGNRIPKAPLLRKIARRGEIDSSLDELAELLLEAAEEVKRENLAREDLDALRDGFKLKGKYPLDRVVEKWSRGNLGGWVFCLSSEARRLCSAFDRLGWRIAAEVTGSQALDYLESIWADSPPGSSSSADSALRYVLEDIEEDEELAHRWESVLPGAKLLVANRWHRITERLLFDDVGDERLHDTIRDRGYILVPWKRLGSSTDQATRAAKKLGLGILSDTLIVEPGHEVDHPGWGARVDRVLSLLSRADEDAKPLSLQFHDTIGVEFEGQRVEVESWVREDKLLLDARVDPGLDSGLIVFPIKAHYSIDSEYVSHDLTALINQSNFAENFEILFERLARELGYEMEATSEPPTASIRGAERTDALVTREADEGTDNARSSFARTVDNEGWLTSRGRVETELARASSPHSYDANAHNPHLQESHISRPRNVDGISPPGFGKDDRSRARRHYKRKITRPRAAADHARIMRARKAASSEPSERNSPSPTRLTDEASRNAVVHYEESRGRRALVMPDNHPGYDVESCDHAGTRRLIEIKGVKGRFEGGSSVVLTARQFWDAIDREVEGEYWLYVVEHTDQDKPKIYPIPWTAHIRDFGQSFYGDDWLEFVEH